MVMSIVIGALALIAAFGIGFGAGYFRGMDAAKEIERGNW